MCVSSQIHKKKHPTKNFLNIKYDRVNWFFICAYLFRAIYSLHKINIKFSNKYIILFREREPRAINRFFELLCELGAHGKIFQKQLHSHCVFFIRHLIRCRAFQISAACVVANFSEKHAAFI